MAALPIWRGKASEMIALKDGCSPRTCYVDMEVTWHEEDTSQVMKHTTRRSNLIKQEGWTLGGTARLQQPSSLLNSGIWNHDAVHDSVRNHPRRWAWLLNNNNNNKFSFALGISLLLGGRGEA
jgi:hypothetical protein